MKVTILAGEASGDLYGAELALALRDLNPEVQVSGLGGPRMRRAGVSLLRDTSTWGAIGVVNALKVVPRALLALSALKGFLRDERPNVVVPIDFGAFNVRAGRMARSLGLPVYYFIAPGSWRREGPVSPRMLQSADVFCSQLPWHADRLRAAGVNAEFFGHPLLDLARPSAPAAELRRQWGLVGDSPVVCLLPGSRRHEVEHILPVFLDAAARIRSHTPGARFVLGLAEVVDRRQVAGILSAHGWTPKPVPGDVPWETRRRGDAETRESGRKGERANEASATPTPPHPHTPTLLVATGRTYDCLAVARAALCASGTVTLEAAILGVPQVIAYRGSLGMRVQYWLVKKRIKYVGLPNILLDEPVCPELLDVAATPESIAGACIPLLVEGAAAQAQLGAIERLRGVLGRPGTIRRAAERIVEVGTVP